MKAASLRGKRCLSATEISLACERCFRPAAAACKAVQAMHEIGQPCIWLVR